MPEKDAKKVQECLAEAPVLAVDLARSKLELSQNIASLQLALKNSILSLSLLETHGSLK